MRFSFAFVACLAFWEGSTTHHHQVNAFVVPRNTAPKQQQQQQPQSSIVVPKNGVFSPIRNTGLFRLSSTAEAAAGAEAEKLSDDEWNVITGLYNKSTAGGADDDGAPSLDQVVLEALPTMNPSLIMKLRGAVEDSRDEFKAVADAMNNILDARLAAARDLLTDLLNAGEIRKLDAMIGKAARENRLDVAFFQVLNMNLQDAASKVPTESADGLEDQSANRFQIMQHVYTRCQEEVEKTIPPGVALLNKLLRTDVNSIRQNQLNHYLCPQPNIIKSPDGKEIELQGGGKILVPHEDFVEALANAVKQIRTVENAGGADREMAANMVEACRTVAKEARIVIGEHFGRESDELIKYEEGLQPVFRPESPESPYMKGEE